MAEHPGAAERLRDSLLRAARALQELDRPEQLPAGVTASTRAVLDPLGDALSLPAGELARIAGLSPSALSHALARLERSGLVERERQRGDARVVLVRLTRHGRRVMQPARIARARLLDRIDERLAPEEAARLADDLERLARFLRASDPGSGTRPA
jgi:DNA-binding MarR family transcriptional regulator